MTALAVSISGLARRVGRFDRVWLILAAAVLAGLAIAPGQTQDSLVFTARALLGVAPFLAVAVAIAAGAKASGADSLIAIAFRGKGVVAIAAAALFGALSPFCSCGVIPVIAALLAMGVPLPAVMAFWLSSPIMDPQMFFLTAGPLGLTFATAKTLAAISLGLFGGLATYGLMRAGGFQAPLREALSGASAGGCGGPTVATTAEVAWRFWREPLRSEVFLKESLQIVGFLGKWLTLAFLLGVCGPWKNSISYLPARKPRE